MATKTCLQCRKEFERKSRRNNTWWRKAKYCSLGCSAKSKIGKVGPTKGRPSPNKGKKASFATREKQSLAKLGKAHWNKGIGVSRGSDVRNTRKYKAFRLELIVKAEYRCCQCGGVNGRLELDHIKPVKFYPELVWDETNLRVLCRECHKKTPTYGIKVFTYGDAS